jgi:exosortase/archaeosortase
MTFEHKSEPLLSRWQFLIRMAKYISVSGGLIVFSLFIGILGYHYLNDLDWLDSLLNASMILAGMGPVDALKNESAKLFASFYAIFSGVVFLTTVAVMLSPIAHRVLHKLHLQE